MEKGSAEHETYKAAYNAERERRRKDPVDYPWFTYHMYGWHRMDYISEEEKNEEVKTYRLMEYTDEYGKKGYKRYGRQPIQIVWNGDRKVDE